MPAPWTRQRNQQARKELRRLYNSQNKTIGEIAAKLGLGETTVYEQLKRLDIPIIRQKKANYNNCNSRILIPKRFSADLAEFIGILLGDGHLTPTQVTVTLGTKEEQYVRHVAVLMEKLFCDRPRQHFSKRNYWVVYLGSSKLIRWLLEMGMAFNKVKLQVGIPRWCFQKNIYKQRVMRGLIDTDGSIYKLGKRKQISLCNCSQRLLSDARKILLELGFTPSRISAHKIYLTKKVDIQKYEREIGFSNGKHIARFQEFTRRDF